MFEKCIKCDRIGRDCIPNLMQLSFPDLLKWWDTRQKNLAWTNQRLADESDIPLGTINRIKGGDNADCRYFTIRKILLALIGGIADEFPCKEKMDQELQRMEALERQAARATELEAENARLKEYITQLESLHHQEMHEIHEEHREELKEHREEIAFLKEQLRAWQHRT